MWRLGSKDDKRFVIPLLSTALYSLKTFQRVNKQFEKKVREEN